MNERLIQHKDVQLCTQNFGQVGRPTVLLIMGATASMLWWDTSFCQQLASKGYFVIRYDNRDVGQSTTYTPGPPPYRLDDLVDDVIAILNGYELLQAHLVGMSLGGLIAQMAALKYPESVKSLTLISTGPWGDSDPTIPEMDPRIVAFQAKRVEIDWTDEQAVVEYMVQGARLMSGRKPFDENKQKQLIRAEFKRATHYLSMFNHASLQGGEEFYGRVSEITQPTLLIHGTDDLIWSYKHTDVLLAELKDVRRITLEGTGHELHVADWITIVSAIANHISSVMHQ